VRYEWLGVAFAVLLVQVVIASQRWVWVLRALFIDLPLRQALRIVFVGLFFNQTLPTTLGGDIARVLELRRTSIALGRATTSVVLDRISALLAIVILVVLSLPLALPLIDKPIAQLSMATVAIGGLCGLAVLAHIDLLFGLQKRWRLPDHIALFVGNARHVLLSPTHCARTLGSSLVVAMISGITVGLIARSLNIDVGLLTCCILVPPVMLLTTLPISLAGWGVREAAMVVALSYVHVGSADALLLSLAYGLIVMAIGLPGGVIWLAGSLAAPSIEVSNIKSRSSLT
jgi:uncharacterized membrane protein YbhN (UPF0104 family)